MKRYFVLLFVIVLGACSKPIDTIVPTAIDKMESIKPQIEKLTPEEKDLFLSYLADHNTIPEGLTIGKAIDEERGIIKKKASELKALQEKLRSLKEDWRFESGVDKFTDEKKHLHQFLL
jgi:hypothetical protein